MKKKKITVGIQNGAGFGVADTATYATAALHVTNTVSVPMVHACLSHGLLLTALQAAFLQFKDAVGESLPSGQCPEVGAWHVVSADPPCMHGKAHVVSASCS